MKRCLSTLAPLDEEGYSGPALARLSDRRKFPHKLPFSRQSFAELRASVATKMSISGFQDKLSMRLHRGVLTVVGDGGTYLLKPIPGIGLPRLNADVPANEHITMQLAEQIFGIRTAANALIRLADGELAYITRRFDRTGEGKVAQEDFCQLMEVDPSLKYKRSYEALGATLRRYSNAYTREREDLLRRIVFNFAVSNGDAHLRNFSMMEQPNGDFVLTPAYDLLSSGLHLPNEHATALDLFRDGPVEGPLLGAHFLELGRRLHIPDRRALAIVGAPGEHQEEVCALVDVSFLSPKAKRLYQRRYQSRVTALAR